MCYSEFLLLPFSALAFICLHYGLFAANGQGIIILSVLGEVLEIISQSLFMLLLLLLAMGWAITRQELNCKILLFGLWTTYTILSCLLYVWMKVRFISGLKSPKFCFFGKPHWHFFKWCGLSSDRRFRSSSGIQNASSDLIQVFE